MDAVPEAHDIRTGGAGIGIRVLGGGSHVEDNTFANNHVGISARMFGNIFVRNAAHGNALNWSIAAGNVCLVVNATPSGGAINGDSGALRLPQRGNLRAFGRQGWSEPTSWAGAVPCRP